MKNLLLLILMLPFIVQAHPGVGIVKDSKGNIYYTDLEQVWKITNGNKTLLVPHVHTHELYIDKNDDLYGEGGYYDHNSVKFYHYLWVYRNGKIDTVIGMKQAYINQDFSLARDKRGNEYYIKNHLAQPDTNHIYKKTPEGKETIIATGNFKGVNWIHAQENGVLYYVLNNVLYKVDTTGNISLIKEDLGNKKPSFKFWRNSLTIWGVWKDNLENVYVAVFSDQTVRKIDANGNMTDIYKSKGNWTPLHGVFDLNNKLWILETSDKNEVRVTLVEATKKTGLKLFPYITMGGLLFGLVIFFVKSKK